jgi:hypothetical protein
VSWGGILHDPIRFDKNVAHSSEVQATLREDRHLSLPLEIVRV